MIHDPGRPATIPGLVAAAAERFGGSEALLDGDTRLSFEELAGRVDQMARVLIARGIQPGDRVALWAPNIWEWVVAVLGAHTAAAVAVPINTRFKGPEAAYVLARSRSRMLFTVTDFLDTDYVELLRAANTDITTPTLPDGLEIVVMRGHVPEGAIGFDELMSPESTSDKSTPDKVRQNEPSRSESAGLPNVSASDTCHVMFTSGTTGQPKGVVLNHGAICRAYRSWADVIGLRHGDRYLIVNPFFHSFGLNAGILACLMTGATMIPHAVFDVPSIMGRITAERISVLPGPPAIYQTILNHPDLHSFDMSTLRLAVTGAAPVPVPMIEAMRERLGFEVVVTGYGLTEASGIATMCRHDDDPETISTTSGRAIDHVEVQVVDADGAEVPAGEPGEIVVRGYNVMNGYLNDPEATAATIDPHGWLHTGDIGVMNDSGYVAITDRLKDMFICGGFNAYPAEIESAMLAHPAVGQVAVVGEPHSRLGEVGHAFVVPSPAALTEAPSSANQASVAQQTALAEQMIAWCRDRMANFKAPRAVTFVNELPLNASGKVLKHVLRNRLTSTGD